MMKIDQIRNDLKGIRYYYSHMNLFEAASKLTGSTNVLVNVVRRYNEVMSQAEPMLYEIYAQIYLFNKTQATAAEDMGYSDIYIRRLNRKLVSYLEEKIDFDTDDGQRRLTYGFE